MDLPKYNSANKAGSIGMTILTNTVQKELGWIVRPNHNETDFGIDAYIDLISEFGQVTGKTIASQVKTGKSYFEEKNELGWVYRDDMAHLNYYLNHDIPVVIFLVNDKTDEVFWCYCDPMNTESTGKQWKITIPFKQKLVAEAKKDLMLYVSPIKDYVSQLNHFWEENEELKKSEKLVFVIDKCDIHNESYDSLKKGLDRLQVNPSLISKLRGKVEIVIHGYDLDKRELPEIPEVKNWVRRIFADTVGLSYFLTKKGNETFFLVLMMCFMKYRKIKGSARTLNGKEIYKLRVDLTDKTFLELVFNDLNSFTEKHNLSQELNKEVTYEIGERVTGLNKASISSKS